MTYAGVKNHFFRTFVDIIRQQTMLRIILIFILIYLIFRIILFHVIPKIGQWYLNRHRDRFYRNNPAAAKAKQRRDQKQMHINQNNEHGTTNTEGIGEYVDFEEINDDD